MARFDERKEIFLANVAAEVLFNSILQSQVINWDQTGLSLFQPEIGQRKGKVHRVYK